MLYKTAPSLEEIQSKVILDTTFASIADKYEDEQLFMIISTLNKYLKDMKSSNQNKILLELALIKVTKYLSQAFKNDKLEDTEYDILKTKIAEIEKQLQNYSIQGMDNNTSNKSNKSDANKIVSEQKN